MSILSCAWVSQGNLAPRGRGGGQRAVRPITPRSFSVGAWADGRERGAGGGEESSSYSVGFSVGSEIEGMESPSEVQRSEGDSMLSIERMVMRERAP